MVFYRKYRPQKIHDLDSQKVQQILRAVFGKSVPDFLDVPHAFLFTGPKGLGKTSTARIIAKVVNCERNVKGKTKHENINDQIEPCDACEMCRSITNGTNMDILEIDAASNRGIDEIRDLKEKIRLSPLQAKKKVYIIDEVHMLTTEAFNALLKTLEEPPTHAMFILCTTEPQKIPDTILSRCLHITFQKATYGELVHAFERIVHAEKLVIDTDVLKEIARFSDGGFRDGTKILEEIVALAEGKPITKALFQQIFKSTNIHAQVLELLVALQRKNIREALQIISDLSNQGSDFSYVLEQLMENLHSVLLIKLTIDTADTESIMQGFVESFSIEDIQKLVGLLTKAKSEMKYTVLTQLPVELAIIEWTKENPKFPVKSEKLMEDASEQMSDQTVIINQQNGKTITVSTMRKQVGNIAKIKALYGEDAVKQSADEIIKIRTTDVSLFHYANKGDITKEWLDAFWKCIISEMKAHNHSIAGVLRGCMIKSFDRKHLILETPFKFHKEKLMENKTLGVLEKVCEGLTGNSVAITIELKKS